MAKGKAQEVERIRKITVKTVFGKIDLEELLAASGKKMDLVTVYGVARRPMPGASDFGSFVAFLGEFKAVNMQTGEMFASNKIILPKIAEEAIAGVIDPNGGRDVKFGILIGVKYNSDVVTKYEYTLKPLTETADADVMAELESELSGKVKMLPAPKKQETEKAS